MTCHVSALFFRTETLEESARVDLLKKQCLEKNAVVVLEKLPITSAQQPQFTSVCPYLTNIFLCRLEMCHDILTFTSLGNETTITTFS